MIFYNTFKSQIEILPRITVLYSDGYGNGLRDPNSGVGLEWLWFGMFIYFKKRKL